MDQFLAPETDTKRQFLEPETDVKCQFLLLGPETDILCQFLEPETDIMGERNYIASVTICHYWYQVLSSYNKFSKI